MNQTKPLKECLLMLAVFRSCMATRTLPAADSPCARKVDYLLSKYDPSGEFAPEDSGTFGKHRLLKLTLKKRWFDMIASGEKTEEYRFQGDWIFSRLSGKDYDAVEFSNGYGKHVPKVVVQYLGWHQGLGKTMWGAIPNRIYIVIRLGKVLAARP